LYDGGLTADNRPYLVMEFVGGVPITTYCEEKKCTLKETLDLFKQVCKAVEYAHRNLIVHRDLKPDNILVKPDGTVKILDFGIAKILDEELTPEKRVQTKENLHLLSIQYAAPEQVTLEKITTATDVYALGLLLYEMITGRPPFDLKGKKLEEAELIIRFEEPENPSKIIKNASYSKKIKGDLDAIILKVLNKKPEERYTSVDQFMDDIHLHLTSRPISARPNNKSYRLWKFIRRQPGVIAGVFVGLFMISGYLVTLQKHAEQLETERNTAQSEMLRAEQISEFLINMFQDADPFSSSEEMTVREMLDRGTEQVLEDGLIEDLVVRAKFMETLGNVYRRLGALDKAEQLLMDAIQIRRSIYGNINLEIASNLSRIGSLQTDQGDYEGSIETLRKALNIQQKLLGDDHHDTVDTMNNLANALQASNRINESELLYRKIISINRNHEDRQEYLATNLTNLGNLLSEQENYTEAEQLLNEALEIRQRILGREHPRTAVTLNNLAQMLRRSGSAESAEPLLRESIEIRKITLGEDHPSVAIGINNLALALRDMGRFDEAEQLFRESLERRINHYGEEHPAVGIAYYNLSGFKKSNRTLSGS
jgi:eukaryotic-like serine/threonine-protein kinase